jgi:FkbM family methyltransferase
MSYTTFHGEVQDGKHVDQVLREYFSDYAYKGVFFDVGAFEPITISNSYHFEKNGWACYCFEANTNGIPLLKQHRANVYNYAISDQDKDIVEFNIVTLRESWTASYSAISLSDEYQRIFGKIPASAVSKISVPQKTLNSVITNEIPDILRIDIMSLDIEGGELDCLKGLDIHKYKPRVMVIENAMPENKTIQMYLEQFGYKLDKQISYNQYYISDDFNTCKIKALPDGNQEDGRSHDQKVTRRRHQPSRRIR